MKNRVSCALLGLVSVILLDLVLASRPQAAEPIGLTERVEWTKSQVKGSPEPPSPYVVRVAYPDVQFENPLDSAKNKTGRFQQRNASAQSAKNKTGRFQHRNA